MFYEFWPRILHEINRPIVEKLKLFYIFNPLFFIGELRIEINFYHVLFAYWILQVIIVNLWLLFELILSYQSFFIQVPQMLMILKFLPILLLDHEICALGFKRRVKYDTQYIRRVFKRVPILPCFAFNWKNLNDAINAIILSLRRL